MASCLRCGPGGYVAGRRAGAGRLGLVVDDDDDNVGSEGRSVIVLKE